MMKTQLKKYYGESLRNLIIAIEGIDGVGKTTTAKLLAKELGGEYVHTPLSDFKVCRELFENKNPVSRLFFYISALWDAWYEIDKISKEKIVIIDRYLLSTKVYHLVLLKRYAPNFTNMLKEQFDSITPPRADLNICLKVSENTILQRLRNKDVKFDTKLEKDRTFQNEVAEMFYTLSDVTIDVDNKDPFETVDAIKRFFFQLENLDKTVSYVI